jgi:hypothetical protein
MGVFKKPSQDRKPRRFATLPNNSAVQSFQPDLPAKRSFKGGAAWLKKPSTETRRISPRFTELFFDLFFGDIR